MLRAGTRGDLPGTVRCARSGDDRSHVEPAFRREFGYNISVGVSFCANVACVVIDGGGLTIGPDDRLGFAR